MEVKRIQGQVLECLLYAGRALIQHLHLLVTQRHVVEQNEDVEFVAFAEVEVNHVHDAVGLLKKVEGFVVLFFLDELYRIVVQLLQHYRNFVLGNPQFFVVVLVKRVVFIEGAAAV